MQRQSRRSSSRRSLNTVDAEDYRTDEEILGFKPLDVIDELINSVHDSVCDIIDETEQSVSARLSSDKTSVQKGFDVFLDMWAPVLDKYCDKFELFALKNSFKISPEVRTLAVRHERKQTQESVDDSVELYRQQHEDLDQQISEAQNQLYQERCKNQIMSEHLRQLNTEFPCNLTEISAFLDENPLPIDNIIPAMESLSTHFQQFEKILQEFQVEISQLPALDEGDVDLDSKFLSHSQTTNVQSISSLQSITDAMQD